MPPSCTAADPPGNQPRRSLSAISSPGRRRRSPRSPSPTPTSPRASRPPRGCGRPRRLRPALWTRAPSARDSRLNFAASWTRLGSGRSRSRSPPARSGP
ncbi:MAG: hypothetical protein EPN53_00900 [Acidobacteria bacterium]|nr:MAG: hypothetical protein EPN53_00900 [Acidobacteriota bacterium]